jgi:putative transposase
VVTPAEKPKAVGLLVEEGLSQRESCVLLNICRSRLFYKPRQNEDKNALIAAIRALALKHPRYGYRRIHVMLQRQGQDIEIKRVQRLWKKERLAVKPAKKPRNRRKGPWLNPPPTALYPNHVWTYDFMHDQLSNGRNIRLLNIVDECTRMCLKIEVKRSMGAKEVLACLSQTMVIYGIPEFIRSDNGSEFIEKCLREWLAQQGTQTLYVRPGSPWENGKCESFNGKFRDEYLNRETFHSLMQAQVQTQWWRLHYNAERPHSALNYRTPLEFYEEWKEGKEGKIKVNMDELKTLCYVAQH